MAKKVPSPGGHPPQYTGKGRKGTGLGYHGKPGNAQAPAQGMGYHGHPPDYVTQGRRAKGPTPHKPPMVVSHSKPGAHKAGSTRRVGRSF